MKKVLLATLALAIGMTGFAQTKNQPVKVEKKKVGTTNIYKKAFGGINEAPIMEFTPSQAAPANQNRDPEFLVDHQTMMTTYDLQSNGFVANRMHRFEDGTVGIVATYSQQSSMADRGTGYNYYNGSEFLWDCEDNPIPGRIEIEKTGWPCYTQYGPEGEIIISHASFGTNNAHLCYYTRETKGEGEWQGPYTVPNPEDLGTTVNLMTWPKIATSGDNHNIIHVLGADQDEDNLADSYLYYSRSTDGENWTTTFVPTLEDWEHTVYGSDYYALAANGNTVAILLIGDVMAHTYVIKSDDNGETWKKIEVWHNPYGGMDWENDPATLFGCQECDDNCYGPETGAICIDNNGMVHCTSTIMKNLARATISSTARASTAFSTGTKTWAPLSPTTGFAPMTAMSFLPTRRMRSVCGGPCPNPLVRIITSCAALNPSPSLLASSIMRTTAR